VQHGALRLASLLLEAAGAAAGEHDDDADLPAAVLKRKAVVYVRQSTQAQVQSNLEGRRRQYELVESPGAGASASSR
jgi:hypothetical protein